MIIHIIYQILYHYHISYRQPDKHKQTNRQTDRQTNKQNIVKPAPPKPNAPRGRNTPLGPPLALTLRIIAIIDFTKMFDAFCNAF